MNKASLHAKEVSLDSVCYSITDGKHGDCENQDGSGYFFLSAKDVKEGKLKYDDARQITKEDFLDTHKRTKLEPRDILISNSGTIGRMAIAQDTELTYRTTFQKSVAILKPNQEQVFPLWLFYYLNHVKEDLINKAGGTAQKNLLLRDMKPFPIQLCPLEIQRKIAAILSAYDDLIENNTRRIKILEEIARLIYREWFVNFRFPGHEKVRMMNSHLGKVPEGWEVKKLRDVADVNVSSIEKGSEPNEINYVDIASVSTGQIDNITPMALANAPGRARRIVSHGDVIWSSVRPNRKSYSLIINPLPNLIVSTGFTVLTARSVPYTYLYHAVTTDDFVGYLTNHATGAAYPAVNAEDFKNAKILVPSQKLLTLFHNIAADVFNQRENLQRKNGNLRRTRDLLLPKLISGEVDVEHVAL